MKNHMSQLSSDASFQQRAAALEALLPKQVRPLDEMFDRLRQFTAVRRREVRIARLEKAERTVTADLRLDRERLPEAVQGFATALTLLSQHANELRAVIAPPLDEVISLAADEGHPLRTMLHDTAVSIGFSTDEAGWLLTELAAIDYQPVSLVCAGGFEDLQTLLACVSAGESGLLLAGFVRFTGDPDTDERLSQLVLRLREKGVTATLFLALAIVLAAHAVAARRSAH